MNLAVGMNLKEKIEEYPNFPKKGILFRDFSPILKDPSSLSVSYTHLTLPPSDLV